MEQRTDAWFAARLGCVTASRISDVIAKTKTGYGAGRETYMMQLAAERLTGQQVQRFSNAAMEWGVEQEGAARDRFMSETGLLVEEVGFIRHPSIEFAGASPDGLVGDDSILEIKCPTSEVHLEYLLADEPPKRYYAQIMWQLACLPERSKAYFVSFDPRMRADMQIRVIELARDGKFIEMLEQEVKTFLQELDEKIKLIEKVKA